jgi:hypothetical protein
VSLGKAFYMNFITPPKCKTGYPATVKDLVSMLVF